jgi:hypothetical protein
MLMGKELWQGTWFVDMEDAWVVGRAELVVRFISESRGHRLCRMFPIRDTSCRGLAPDRPYPSRAGLPLLCKKEETIAD